MLSSMAMYFQVNILRIFLFGIINGTVLLVSSSTINFWLASNKIDIEKIGFFSLIILPQALKYFIAIFIDFIKIPFISKKIGNYRSWLVLSELVITLILFSFGYLDPTSDLSNIAILGFVFSIFSVIQYVILNGNRILILNPHEQAAGVATYNVGYRVGNFLATAGVIYLSIFMTWKMVFFILAFSYMIASLFALTTYQEPTKEFENKLLREDNKLIKTIFAEPINKFGGAKNFLWIILFILIYQAADSMMMSMLNPFLLFKDYSQENIASASKTCGLVMVVIGGIIGGVVTNKATIKNSLVNLAVIHTLSYVMLVFLSLLDKNVIFLYIVTGYAAFTGGMTTTAYFSFISKLSYGKNASSIYALLSSLIGLAWVVFPAFSGVLANNLGWTLFFVLLTFVSILIVFYTLMMPTKVFHFTFNNNH